MESYTNIAIDPLTNKIVQLEKTLAIIKPDGMKFKNEIMKQLHFSKFKILQVIFDKSF